MKIDEIIAAIHQAATDAMDHPYNGKEAGLDREEGNKITDSRVVDGFRVSISGNILTILYHVIVPMKKAKEEKYEQELDQMLAQLASYLKKTFKSETGSALKLKELGEMEAIFQNMSTHKSMVQAKKSFEIGNIDLGNEDPKPGREKIVNDLDLMESYDPTKAFRKFVNNE